VLNDAKSTRTIVIYDSFVTTISVYPNRIFRIAASFPLRSSERQQNIAQDSANVRMALRL